MYTLRHVRASELRSGQKIVDKQRRLWEVFAVAEDGPHVVVYVIARDGVDRPGVGLLTEKGKLANSRIIELGEVRERKLDPVFGLAPLVESTGTSKETRLRLNFLSQQTVEAVVV